MSAAKLEKLVIASHNEGKVAEIGELIAPLGIHAISAAKAGIDEPEETGATFAENAELKARHSAAKSGLCALADDSGLAVAGLDGAPGIYSARWAGPNKDFGAAFERIRNELEQRACTDLSASFICALCLCMPSGESHVFEGRIDGTLVFPPRGERGFGYDPIFIPEGYNITFAEIDPQEKNRISHRARAFAKFLDFLEKNAKLNNQP